MKAESVVIHKGGKEEKYQIYVEDYVMSYLKYETGTLELSEIYFYGYCDRNAEEYIIYGAGKDKQIAIFDKYKLLDKIVCRLTQGGPVFMVREQNGLYEIKGYDIFYHKNEEMQCYLVDSKQKEHRADKADSTEEQRSKYYKADNVEELQSKYAPSDRQTTNFPDAPGKHIHNAVSVQLGIIFVILIAIVINSTNSFDKIQQLNQSAKEVFFAIENQEAEDIESADGIQEELVAERDLSESSTEEKAEEELLKLPLDEMEENTAGSVDESTAVNSDEADAAANPVEGDATDHQTEEDITDNQTEDGTTDNEAEQETAAADEEGILKPVEDEMPEEALSRSVTRYYEVERGDTLYMISEEIYGDASKVKEICELNHISDPDNIHYGQKIILP